MQMTILQTLPEWLNSDTPVTGACESAKIAVITEGLSTFSRY